MNEMKSLTLNGTTYDSFPDQEAREDSKIFWVTAPSNEPGTYAADPGTYQQIMDAYEAGRTVLCKCGNLLLPLTSAVSATCVFGGINNVGVYHQVIIGSENIVMVSTRQLGGTSGGNAESVSPVATVTQTASGAVISVTDQNGTTTATVTNGKDGYTPVKGVDYFTEADKQELIEELDVKKPVYAGNGTSNNLFDGAFEPGSLTSAGADDDTDYAVANYVRSENYIAAEGGRKLCFNSATADVNSVQLAQYDMNKQLIGSLANLSREVNRWTSNGITLNAATCYVRFYCQTASEMNFFYIENINEMFADPGDVFVYIPHSGETYVGEYIPADLVASPLTAKKIVYDGDSICIGTYGGGGYAKLIADKVGGFYENQAVGGARLVTQEGNTDSFHSVVDNLGNLPADADLYCFDGGLNDVWTSTPLGTYDMSDYTGEVDKTTICGALETIFRYCLDNFVGKPVFFVITHKVSNVNYENYKNYHDSAVAICNKYSIPFYDAYNESGLNGWNTAQNNMFLTGNAEGTADGCHPNKDGYNRYYVPQLIQLFERIMPMA